MLDDVFFADRFEDIGCSGRCLSWLGLHVCRSALKLFKHGWEVVAPGGLIDNTALRRLQASLDMEELELDRGRASGEG